MNKLLLSLTCSALATSTSYGILNIDFTESGADLVVTYSGSHDTWATTYTKSELNASIVGTTATLSFAQARDTGSFEEYEINGVDLTTPVPWDGLGLIAEGGSASGHAGMGHISDLSRLVLFAPSGYTAGETIFATSTLSNVSLTDAFDAAEISAGSGTITFSGGADAVSYTHLRAPRDGATSRMPSSA